VPRAGKAVLGSVLQREALDAERLGRDSGEVGSAREEAI